MAANGARHAEAGAVLQDLVDFAIARGLKGLETLVGHSRIGGRGGLRQRRRVRPFHLRARARGAFLRWRARCACSTTRSASSTIARAFSSATRSGSFSRPSCALEPADAAELRKTADDILKVRNEKFPVTMKCAGSIFKNLLLRELPPTVAAAGARGGGARRQGSGRLVSGAGGRQGHAARRHPRGRLSRQPDLQCRRGHRRRSLRALIAELKQRVRERFGIELEEEVQYVGQ